MLVCRGCGGAGGRSSGAEAHADDPEAVAVVGCGRPRQPVVIVDSNTHLECGPDEVGEIWIAGLGVARGYWNAPVATDQIFEAFLADGGGGPFLRTGDTGFLRGEELFVIGRCKDLVVVGGVHYYPGELEATVADCHAVLLTGRGAVFADESERLVVLHEASCAVGDAERDVLVSRIQTALFESYGVQADSIVLVEAMRLPTAPGGVIRRGACRWQYLDGELVPLAQWRSPCVDARESRETNVVELTAGVSARGHRVYRS